MSGIQPLRRPPSPKPSGTVQGQKNPTQNQTSTNGNLGSGSADQRTSVPQANPDEQHDTPPDSTQTKEKPASRWDDEFDLIDIYDQDKFDHQVRSLRSPHSRPDFQGRSGRLIDANEYDYMSEEEWQKEFGKSK